MNYLKNIDNSARLRCFILLLTINYFGFVIYGSLVPLDFHPKPLSQAWQDFRQIRFLDLGIGSRADWVANILLFIPLAFLLMEVLARHRDPGGRTLLSILILGALFLLALAIEFTQQFFPPRTVSQNDILAESLGALIGIGLWHWQGWRVYNWFATLPFVRGLKNKILFVLYLYLAGLCIYNVLPLDLTLSPVELYHKWKDGRLSLIPFAGLAKLSPAQAIYELVTDILIWVPPAILWRYQSPPQKAWLRTITAAASIELLQLFVYSRVSDITDLFSAAVGGWLGIQLFAFIPRANALARQQEEGEIIKRGAGISFSVTFLYGLWVLILLLIFGYPFQFDFTPFGIQIRLDQAFRVPFTAYYFGTEFRAITEVLHKILFFFPLGANLVFFPGFLHATGKRWLKVIALTAIPAAMVETEQLFLADKHPDWTDWFLETLGGIAGFWTFSFLFIHSKKDAPAIFAQPSSPHEPSPGNGLFQNTSQAALFAWFIGVAGLIFLVLPHLPGVPYNVRELFTAGIPFIGPFLMAGIFCWLFAFPAWCMHRIVLQPWPSLLTHLKWIGLYLLVGAMGLWITTPLESLHDLVGTPVTILPKVLEIIGRLVALLIPLAITLFAAALGVVHRLYQANYMTRHWGLLITATILLLPMSYLIVVIFAATDNLIELFREEGHSLAIIGLPVYLLLSAQAATWLSVALTRPSRLAVAGAWLIGSLSLGYFCLDLALEPVILKYEQAFSAWQFLLSPDREHLLSGLSLLLRFGIAHCGWVMMMALFQLPAWAGQPIHIPKPQPRRPISSTIARPSLSEPPPQ